MHKYKRQICLEEICSFELDILFSFEGCEVANNFVIRCESMSHLAEIHLGIHL